MIYLKNVFKFFKNSLNKEVKLVNLFLTQVILVTSLLFVAILYFLIKQEYSDLKDEISTTQKEFLESEKKSIKEETERAISYINYKISQTDDNIRKKLKNRASLAHNIATNIYNKNKNAVSSNEIKKLNEPPRSKLRGIKTNQTISIGLNVTFCTPFLFLDFSNTA